jgi:hypothetical protein
MRISRQVILDAIPMDDNNLPMELQTSSTACPLATVPPIPGSSGSSDSPVTSQDSPEPLLSAADHRSQTKKHIVASEVAGRTTRRLGARRLFMMELWKNERKEKGYKRQRRC